MSKQQLEDIKDKYAKVNYDNGESHATSWQELLDNDLSFDNEDIDALMELAYNQALEDANEVVFYQGLDFVRSEDYNQKSEHRFSDIQQSILKLKIK